MRLVILLVLLVSLGNTVLLQAQLFDVTKLRVQWEVVENNHKGEDQFLSALTLINKSKSIIPNKGWTLYFSFVREIAPESVRPDVNIRFIKGDLYALSPATGFKGIESGASCRIEFTAGEWVANFTDSPTGFYIVFDDKPAEGISVDDFIIKPSTEAKQFLRSVTEKAELITPKVIFEQNKTIDDITAQALSKIFPTPVSYREMAGVFELNSTVQIIPDAEFKQEAEYLAIELATLLGKRPVIGSVNGRASEKKIYFKKVDMAQEAYHLLVNKDEIIIEALTSTGIFYGIQSLKSLLPPLSWSQIQTSINVPLAEVTDAPRFAYRGFFLDVCRHFHSKKEVLKVLDLMSLYKLNVFHFHLTEDEGWRLEIPSLPELTAVGSKRGHTLDSKKHLPPSFGSGPNISEPTGSGFYTQSDFVEILKYATARHIKVIPEIETPGHARAAVKSMEARYARLLREGKKDEAEKYLLTDLQDQSVYKSVQGWNDNVINVALPSTYNFIELITDELISMYKTAGAPISTIHFGGDEVPAGVWERSPAVKKLMESNTAVKTIDDLWYYYYGKVNEIVKKRGLYLSGWEEIAMRKTKTDGKPSYVPNPDFVHEHFQVDVWNNVLGSGAEDLAYRLANAGYKVVLSCVSHQYFDMAYYRAFDEPGYYWGAFVDVDKPFSFIPYDYFKNSTKDKFGSPLDRSVFTGKDKLTDYGKSNIVGIKGLLWSETITSPERLEYMILPKMLGLAERAWSPDPEWAIEPDPDKSKLLYTQAWSRFVNAIGKRELPRLDNYAGGFNYRIPTAGAVVEGGQVIVNVQYPGLSVRYTRDGKEPSLKSKVYTGPITEKGKIKLKVFNSKGRGSRTVEVDNR